MKKLYKINGMSCSVCAGHVEKAAGKVAGVSEAVVNLTANTLKVTWDEGLCSEKDIAAEIKAAGYEMVLSSEESQLNKLKRQKTGLFVSVLLLLFIMYLSMGHMIRLPLPSFFSHGSIGNVYAQFVLCVPVLAINFRFFKRGIPLLLKGQPNMDTLIAVGGGSAFLYSVFSMFMIIINGASKHSVCFETAAMILTLVSVGKYLESRAKQKTGSALDKLNSMVPATAELFLGETTKTVPAESLVPEDIIVVREGVLVPADGVVVYGSGILDESGLTGESVPVDKLTGDSVKAGTVNLKGVFRLRVVNAGNDTVISKMVALVQDAAATKAPVARLADRVSGVFVPVVMGIALVAALVWFFITKDFEVALKMGVTVLVVSCPCSLGLATPVAVTAAIYKSAENGILVKSAEVFELIKKTGTIVLDKTGTITEGKPAVMGVKVFDRSLSEDDIIRISGAVESASNHPFATAFSEEASRRALSITPAEDYENVPGRGITGVVSNEKYFIGNAKFVLDTVAEENIERYILNDAEKESENGYTPLLLFTRERILGYTLVADRVKSEAAMAVSELKKRGKRVVMLTGDNKKTAKTIAKKAGIDEFEADVFPHEKEAFIRSLEDEGNGTVMIGDGINDSAALTRARVGIAMGSGTDIAIESADCVLLKNSLFDIITLLDTSSYALRIIKQNLFWALFYNCLCIPLAAGVFAPLGIGFSPMFASAAMSLSSLFVVTNALRIMGLKPKAKDTFIDNDSSIEGNAFLGKNNKGDEYMKHELNVEGMMCVKCKAHVEKALMGVEGVKAVTVSLEDKTAVCECEAGVSKETLEAAVIEAGYEIV